MPHATYSMISTGFACPDIKLEELEREHGLFRFFFNIELSYFDHWEYDWNSTGTCISFQLVIMTWIDWPAFTCWIL